MRPSIRVVAIAPVIAGVILTISGTLPPATPALSGTPRAAPSSFGAAPSQCQAPLVSIAELEEVIVTASPVPLIRASEIEGGAAVDQATSEAVTRTLVELIACFNAGEPLRAYSLYTDAYLSRVARDQTLSLLATPQPLDTDEWTRIVEIRDIRRLDDGRARATVVLEPALIPVHKLFIFILSLEGSRWLIDGVIDEITFSLP
jgi:hypothetical protein